MFDFWTMLELEVIDITEVGFRDSFVVKAIEKKNAVL